MITDDDKIKSIQDDILDFSQYHCEFHYQGSYEYFNVGCGYLKLGMLSDSITCFSKSIEVYKENADSYYARGFAKFLLNDQTYIDDFRSSFKYRNIHQEIYINDHMNYIPYSQIQGVENFSFINRENTNTKYEALKGKQLEVLYEHAKIALKAKNFADFVDIGKSIIQTTSALHFEYHVNLANKNFALAMEYDKLGKLEEACFFANKALEADEKNPHNTAYQNLISTCRLKIDEKVSVG